jgi:hypothetical protein
MEEDASEALDGDGAYDPRWDLDARLAAARREGAELMREAAIDACVAVKLGLTSYALIDQMRAYDSEIGWQAPDSEDEARGAASEFGVWSRRRLLERLRAAEHRGAERMRTAVVAELRALGDAYAVCGRDPVGVRSACDTVAKLPVDAVLQEEP